jgi:hypothetical protein
MKLRLAPKLVEKLVWVPVISLPKAKLRGAYVGSRVFKILYIYIYN